MTRLAPSPTGSLHLGNARTFLVNWALARRLGWRIVLRIEDLDTPRVKPGIVALTIDLLRWLGIDWDEGPVVQSHDWEPYRAAMRELAAKGLAYPSELSRADVAAAASAPQEGSQELRFPASLRPVLRPGAFEFGDGPAPADDGRAAPGWRFVVPDSAVAFTDRIAGAQSRRPWDSVGDFVVWTRRPSPAYQLAVVVDDHRQGVTDIVRGDDLLDSAARQLLLYRALGRAPEPTYWHLPLVVGADGQRLAKRHGDSRLDAYRARGVEAERVIGLLARWCGLVGLGGLRSGGMSADEFRAGLDVDRIPKCPITFTPEDDAWLVQRS